MKIKLLQRFNGNVEGSCIDVTDKIGKDLINQGVATTCVNKDYIINSNLGETKAFGTSPKSKQIKNYEKKF